MRPVSRETPSRLGPRISGQSPIATRCGPWVVTGMERVRRIATARDSFFSITTIYAQPRPSRLPSVGQAPDVCRGVLQARLAAIMASMYLSMTARSALTGGFLALIPVTVHAQGPPAGQVGPFQLPPVTVTAQKEPADAQTLPISVTAVSSEGLADAGVGRVRDAAVYSPNTYFSDFTARKLSNPRFRGIGSSPANPSITTYFDGVPQLNSNTSSIDLLDVEQVEFVRGPQSALFGRNTLAGVINVTSMRPSLTEWTSSLSAPLSNFDSRNVRGSVSGPLVAGRVGISGSIGYGRRAGFTFNRVTGRDVDSREALTGKGQVLWTPSSQWETRLIVTGEHARDGDFALSDLGGLRDNPFEVSRDFEGHTDRDLVATTLLTRRAGSRITLSTTTGFVRWKTQDETDLDYTALPLLRRDNTEKSVQLTQEVRVASAPDAPLQLSDRVPLKWQARCVRLHAELRAGRGQHVFAVRALAVPRLRDQPAHAAVGAR